MREDQTRPSLCRSAFWYLVLAGLVALSGCGDGKIGRYPVSGTVLVDGKPAEGVVVVLCPTSGSEELMKERPIGTSDAAGKFTMMTFLPGDGAPAGEYNVLIQWPKGGGDAFHSRYFNPKNPVLHATVEEGPTELPPFELKSR